MNESPKSPGSGPAHNEVLRAAPDAAHYDRFYAGEGGHAYYERPAWETHYYPMYRLALCELQRMGTTQALEVGCGAGLFAQMLLRDTQIRYHGFDFSAVAVQQAVNRTGRPDCFSVDTAGSTLMDRHPHDTIICLEVLEHIEHDLDVVRQWRPGTKLVCSVPNFDSSDHVRYFRHEDEVVQRYRGLMEFQTVKRVARSLVRGRGWRDYLRQLRWARDNPKRLAALLGWKTFENLAGWIVFCGVRKDAS